MQNDCYRDYGSPVRRARQRARDRLPCSACGSTGEPRLRSPRHYSQEWHRNPATFYGCAGCGRRLAAIPGPAAERASEVALDRVPDPEGTLRAMLIHDPAWVRRMADPQSLVEPLRLEPVVGSALAGIEVRAGVDVWLVAGAGGVASRVPAPLALVRNGLVWVVWEVRIVDEIRHPAAGFGSADLARLPGAASVEAAFTVTIDRDGRWQVSRLRPRREDGPGAPPHRPCRRC